MDTVVFKDVTLLMNAIGVGNCFLLGFSYLKKDAKSQTLGNPVLALLFFILGYVILNTLLNFTGYSALLPGFEPISNALVFAIAPLLFLYLRGLREARPNVGLKSVHLLPFYGYLGISLLALAVPQTVFGQWVQALWEHPWMIVMWNLHFFGYLLMVYREFRGFPEGFPRTAQWIVWGIASIWFLNLLFFLYRIWIHPIPPLVYLNITLFFSALTLYLFYKRMGPEVAERKQPATINPRKVSLSDAETEQWVATIREQKHYRDPELDIRTLSAALQLPYHELSLAINQKFQQNFNSFINSFRVQEVAEALETQQHESFTIMGLAQRAGFKSPSAFYAAFKKEKGMTPTAFLKAHSRATVSCSDL